MKNGGRERDRERERVFVISKKKRRECKPKNPNNDPVFVFLGQSCVRGDEREERASERERREGEGAKRSESGSKLTREFSARHFFFKKKERRVSSREGNQMKSSLHLPPPASLALAPGRVTRMRTSQIGSRGPASLSPDVPAQVENSSSRRLRRHRRHGAANQHPPSSPSSRVPAQVIREAIAPRSSESDSMTAASDRRSAGWYGLQGEAFSENLSTTLDDGQVADDDDDDDAADHDDGGDDGDGEEETRFLDQATLRGRGSLVKGILSLVKEGDPVRQLEISEAYWRAQKKGSKKTKKSSSSPRHRRRRHSPVVERHGAGRLLSDALLSSSSSPSPSSTHLGDFDVVVAGGTLGLLLAAALQGRPCSSLPLPSTESGSSSSSSGSSPPPSLSPSLSRRPLRCAVVERGPRVGGGRVQEWNCSRSELEPLVELGVLTRGELEGVVVTECGPMRVSFLGGGGAAAAAPEKASSSSSSPSSPPPLLTLSGVLDVGVCPVRLMALLREKFEAAGGVVLESREFFGAEVFDDGVLVKTRRPNAAAAAAGGKRSVPLSSCPPPPPSSSSSESSFEGEEEGEMGTEGHPPTKSNAPAAPAAALAASPPPPSSGDGRETTGTLSAALLVDCMGHWSPLVKAARASQEKPDAVCLVVGACVRLKEERKKGGHRDGDGGGSDDGNDDDERGGAASRFSLPRSGGEFLASRSHASPEGADRDVQWLWEQFPAAGGDARTLYQFAVRKSFSFFFFFFLMCFSSPFFSRLFQPLAHSSTLSLSLIKLN